MTDETSTIRPGRTVELEVTAFAGGARERKRDTAVTEEPLELRLATRGRTQTLAITMRTPGNDFELAAGFVYGEGIVRGREALMQITYCVDPAIAIDQRYNIVTIELAGDLPDLQRFERHFTVTSACGVCGRAQLDALLNSGIQPLVDDVAVEAALLYALPSRMRAAQRIFEATGGLHAAALFDERGEILAIREDVGRHNAVDKLVGWGLLGNRLPFARSVLMVSGRAGYEILQKSVLARIPIVCSVSAPSSLAVELAREFNVTLAGFVRDERANVYAAAERIL
ncbi:MAG: formate dehydrogenase accessory sulfurtransferase FdhD [Candidatus Eremiobacteraeota bacterium]|nr:formate dehydrogenase accessory sulfurtransferase FdhD [Candidatus Eremiobacteraeota bacterium]